MQLKVRSQWLMFPFLHVLLGCLGGFPWGPGLWGGWWWWLSAVGPPLLALPPSWPVLPLGLAPQSPPLASGWLVAGGGLFLFGFLGALVGSWLSLGGASLGLRDKRFARLVCFSALGAYVKLPPRSADAGLQKRALTTEATQLRGEIT